MPCPVDTCPGPDIILPGGSAITSTTWGFALKPLPKSVQKFLPKTVRSRVAAGLAGTGALALVLGGFMVIGAPSASAADPGGNNGFIKVNEEEFPGDSTPNNDPHVGCIFNVEFYNYDEGADIFADVTFTAHDPTDKAVITVTGDTHPFIGEDAAGGGNDK